MGVRVLLYSSTSRDNPGGVQAVYTRLAASLREHGHTVTEAWSAAGNGEAGREAVYPLPRWTNRDGVATPRSVGRVLKATGGLIRGLLQYKPDVVNVHFVRHDSIYFLLLRPYFRYKLVLSAHGSDVLSPAGHSSPLLRHLFPRADAITVVNQRLAERVCSYPGVGPQTVHVIPNGVDCDFWGRVDAPKQRDATSPLILSVGRLTHIKGHDVLIDALARLRKRVPGASLVIAGDGEARAELGRLATERGVAEVTKFAGNVSSTEVRSLLHRADVFVLPSRSEGTPLALLQAMAAGVPSVATRVGGVPELIEDGAGILVPPDDADALCAGLDTLIENTELAATMSERSQRRALAFSGSAADEAYGRLFTSLMSQG